MITFDSKHVHSEGDIYLVSGVSNWGGEYRKQSFWALDGLNGTPAEHFTNEDRKIKIKSGNVYLVNETHKRKKILTIS